MNFRPQIEDVLIRTVRYTTTLTKDNEQEPIINKTIYDSLSGMAIKALGKTPIHHEAKILYSTSNDVNEATDNYPPYSISSIYILQDWETRFNSGEFFKDKIIITGPAAQILQDNHQIPVGQLFGHKSTFMHLHAD